MTLDEPDQHPTLPQVPLFQVDHSSFDKPKNPLILRWAREPAFFLSPEREHRRLLRLLLLPFATALQIASNPEGVSPSPLSGSSKGLDLVPLPQPVKTFLLNSDWAGSFDNS